MRVKCNEYTDIIDKAHPQIHYRHPQTSQTERIHRHSASTDITYSIRQSASTDIIDRAHPQTQILQTERIHIDITDSIHRLHTASTDITDRAHPHSIHRHHRQHPQITYSIHRHYDIHRHYRQSIDRHHRQILAFTCERTRKRTSGSRRSRRRTRRRVKVRITR